MTILYGPRISDLILETLPDTPEDAITFRELYARVQPRCGCRHETPVSDALTRLIKHRLVRWKFVRQINRNVYWRDR